MKQRLDWIDIAKGIGIILVVLGHAGRGLTGAGIPDPGGVLPIMDRAIYAFHMPLFFLLSGVTFGMSPPASIQSALTRRVWRILYALVLWTYAFLALRVLAGDSTNAGSGWQDLLVFPLPPFAHFWFLWALLLNIVVFAVAHLLLRRLMPDRWFWIGALGVALALQVTVKLPGDLIPWVGAALRYSLAFAVGGLIGSTALVRVVPPWPVALAGSGLFAVTLWASLAGLLPLRDVPLGLLLSGLLLLPMSNLAARYGTARPARWLAFLGMISLAIYVMHTMFSAALRIVLQKAGVDDLILHLALGTAIGVVGPLIAYLTARRLGLLRIAGLA